MFQALIGILQLLTALLVQFVLYRFQALIGILQLYLFSKTFITKSSFKPS